MMMMIMMAKCKNATGCNNCAFFVYGVNNLCNGSLFLALIIQNLKTTNKCTSIFMVYFIHSVLLGENIVNVNKIHHKY